MSIKWEFLGKQELEEWKESALRIWRTSVPGGWLMLTYFGCTGTQSFYPDPDHIWTGSTTDGADYLLRPAQIEVGTPANQLLRADSENERERKRMES